MGKGHGNRPKVNSTDPFERALANWFNHSYYAERIALVKKERPDWFRDKAKSRRLTDDELVENVRSRGYQTIQEWRVDDQALLNMADRRGLVSQILAECKIGGQPPKPNPKRLNCDETIVFLREKGVITIKQWRTLFTNTYTWALEGGYKDRVIERLGLTGKNNGYNYTKEDFYRWVDDKGITSKADFFHHFPHLEAYARKQGWLDLLVNGNSRDIVKKKPESRKRFEEIKQKTSGFPHRSAFKTSSREHRADTAWAERNFPEEFAALFTLTYVMFTDLEDATIRKYLGAEAIAQIADRLNRTDSSVAQRIHRLGLVANSAKCCDQCSKPFDGPARQRFCSKPCHRKWYNHADRKQKYKKAL